MRAQGNLHIHTVDLKQHIYTTIRWMYMFVNIVIITFAYFLIGMQFKIDLYNATICIYIYAYTYNCLIIVSSMVICMTEETVNFVEIL